MEGLSELQWAAARWIVVRPTLLAIILLSAVGIAAMCIGSQRGRNRYGADPKADDRLPEKDLSNFKFIAYEMVVDLY